MRKNLTINEDVSGDHINDNTKSYLCETNRSKKPNLELKNNSESLFFIVIKGV